MHPTRQHPHTSKVLHSRGAEPTPVYLAGANTSATFAPALGCLWPNRVFFLSVASERVFSLSCSIIHMSHSDNLDQGRTGHSGDNDTSAANEAVAARPTPRFSFGTSSFTKFGAAHSKHSPPRDGSEGPHSGEAAPRPAALAGVCASARPPEGSDLAAGGDGDRCTSSPVGTIAASTLAPDAQGPAKPPAFEVGRVSTRGKSKKGPGKNASLHW